MHCLELADGLRDRALLQLWPRRQAFVVKSTRRYVVRCSFLNSVMHGEMVFREINVDDERVDGRFEGKCG